MEKQPENEILVEPRWPIVFDGHGYDAALVGGMPGTDNVGRRINTLIIKPGPNARKSYNFRADKELNKNGYMKLIVLENDLVPLNPFDKSNERYIYVKSFKHEDTPLSLRDKNLTIKLESREKTILLLQAEKIRLIEQLEIAKTNPVKFMKQGLEIYEAAGKVIADINKKEEKTQ